MPTRAVTAALAALLVAGAAAAAEAQTGRTHLGPRVTYNFDVEEVAIGGQLGLPLGRNLDFYPSVDIFLVDRGSLFGINADLKFRPAPVDAPPLYLGAGLNITRASVRGRSDTDPGLNLLAGVEARTGAVHPFAEIRTILGDRSSVQLSAGVNFTMGGPRAAVR